MWARVPTTAPASLSTAYAPPTEGGDCLDNALICLKVGRCDTGMMPMRGRRSSRPAWRLSRFAANLNDQQTLARGTRSRVSPRMSNGRQPLLMKLHGRDLGRRLVRLPLTLIFTAMGSTMPLRPRLDPLRGRTDLRRSPASARPVGVRGSWQLVQPPRGLGESVEVAPTVVQSRRRSGRSTRVTCSAA